MFWEQGVPGSNPGIPTTENQGAKLSFSSFFILSDETFMKQIFKKVIHSPPLHDPLLPHPQF